MARQFPSARLHCRSCRPWGGELKRFGDLASDAREAGDEILSALPEEVRRRLVMVEIPQAWVQGGWFADEALLKTNIEFLRRQLGAIPAWFEKNIAQPALAQFRAGAAKIAETREASGCEALYREADEFQRQAEELEHRICSTPATSLAGVLDQLQLARDLMELDCLDDREERLNASIIAGVARLATRESDVIVAPIDASTADGGILALFRDWVASQRA
jgi:hypothetical protein